MKRRNFLKVLALAVTMPIAVALDQYRPSKVYHGAIDPGDPAGDWVATVTYDPGMLVRWSYDEINAFLHKNTTRLHDLSQSVESGRERDMYVTQAPRSGFVRAILVFVPLDEYDQRGEKGPSAYGPFNSDNGPVMIVRIPVEKYMKENEVLHYRHETFDLLCRGQKKTAEWLNQEATYALDFPGEMQITNIKRRRHGYITDA